MRPCPPAQLSSPSPHSDPLTLCPTGDISRGFLRGRAGSAPVRTFHSHCAQRLPSCEPNSLRSRRPVQWDRHPEFIQTPTDLPADCPVDSGNFLQARGGHSSTELTPGPCAVSGPLSLPHKEPLRPSSPLVRVVDCSSEGRVTRASPIL